MGAYIDTMETPMAGGIGSIAIAPSGADTGTAAIAVGTVCPAAQGRGRSAGQVVADVRLDDRPLPTAALAVQRRAHLGAG